MMMENGETAGKNSYRASGVQRAVGVGTTGLVKQLAGDMREKRGEERGEIGKWKYGG